MVNYSKTVKPIRLLETLRSLSECILLIIIIINNPNKTMPITNLYHIAILQCFDLI